MNKLCVVSKCAYIANDSLGSALNRQKRKQVLSFRTSHCAGRRHSPRTNLATRSLRPSPARVTALRAKIVQLRPPLPSPPPAFGLCSPILNEHYSFALVELHLTLPMLGDFSSDPLLGGVRNRLPRRRPTTPSIVGRTKHSQKILKGRISAKKRLPAGSSFFLINWKAKDPTSSFLYP